MHEAMRLWGSHTSWSSAHSASISRCHRVGSSPIWVLIFCVMVGFSGPFGFRAFWMGMCEVLKSWKSLWLKIL